MPLDPIHADQPCRLPGPAGRAVSLLGLLVLLIVAVDPAPAGAAFPGANGQIAFGSDRTGSWEIWTMEADGSNETQITHLPGSQGPAFSPTGKDIIFSRANAGVCAPTATSARPPCQVIYEQSSTSTNLIAWEPPLPLSNYSTDTRQPAFSPEHYAAFPSPDTMVVWSTNHSGNASIYAQIRRRLCLCQVKNQPAKLTKRAGNELRPSYSPDGSRIVYDAIWSKGQNGVGSGPGEPNARPRLVALIDTNGLYGWLVDPRFPASLDQNPIVPACLRPPAPRERPSDCSEETWAGTFSPDGKRIAYTYEKRREPFPGQACKSCTDGRFQLVNRGIGMMDPDGRNVERVIQDECATDRLARKSCSGEPFPDEPAFSPDGQRLVYQVNRPGGDVDIWSVNVESCKGGGGRSPCGRDPTRLTFKGRNTQPDWGPQPQP